MRFYKVWYPGQSEYSFSTTIRDLKNLPEGTVVERIFTDRSGHECDADTLPVVNGRVKAKGRTLYGKGTFRVNGPRAGQVRW